MNDKSFISMLILIVIVYSCCMGMIVGNRLRIKRIEKKLDALERISTSTNIIETIGD